MAGRADRTSRKAERVFDALLPGIPSRERDGQGHE
jgi:hypothetical protein